MFVRFLDLPAELRIQIYEHVFQATEAGQVRKYLNNRTDRILTQAGKKGGDGKVWTNLKHTGATALMATSQQVFWETSQMLYANTTFLCERMSDFSQFTRVLGSTNTGLIKTVRIDSHHYHLLPGLKALTGLKTLVVSVEHQPVGRPDLVPSVRTRRSLLRWTRRTHALKALTKFAEVRGCKVRFDFAAPDKLYQSEWLAAGEIEAAAVELDEYVRGLRADNRSIE